MLRKLARWPVLLSKSCTTPAGTAGAQNVVVTNPDTQTSGSSGNGLFSYILDPSTLSLTSWFNSGSGAGPWAHAASAGVSGGQNWTTAVTAPVFITKGGISALAFGHSGSVNAAFTQRTTSGNTSDIGTYITSSGYTVWGLIWLESTQAFQTSTPYQNTVILSGDARWGITVSSSGLGVYHYTGSFPYLNAAMSTGSWHFFCVRYDSTLGKFRVDIDNVAGTDTTVAAFAALSGIPCFGAKNSYTNVTSEYLIRECGSLATRISDATRDKIYAYLKVTYPAAGLP